jgi:hypothetical protein
VKQLYRRRRVRRLHRSACSCRGNVSVGGGGLGDRGSNLGDGSVKDDGGRSGDEGNIDGGRSGDDGNIDGGLSGDDGTNDGRGDGTNDGKGAR